MFRRHGFGVFVGCTSIVGLALALAGCTGSDPSRGGGGGGSTATGGSTGAGGSTGTGTGGSTDTGAGGSTDTGNGGSTSAGSTGGGGATAGGGGGGSTGGGGSASGGAGGGGATGGGGSTSDPDAGANEDGSFVLPPDAAGRTSPTCMVKKPSPIPSQKPTSECDYLLQSLDFEDKWSYPQPPGSIRITDFGTALGYYEINDCSPYCFSKELTIGVDIVGGGDPKALQGEVIVRFPVPSGTTTYPGLPITTALKRDSLAWVQLDGPTKPPFAITAQFVVETTTGIIVAPQKIQVGYAAWLNYQNAEVKNFGITATTFPTLPMNVTGLGFRISAPANLAKGMEWHGLLYLDHLQMRDGAAMKDPTGAGKYPYGL